MPSERLVRSVGLVGGPAVRARRAYLDFAHELGARLGEAGIGLLHSGIAAGMIGAAVGAALAAGSDVVSFVPHRMLHAGVRSVPGCEVHVFRTHSECKRLVRRYADGFVVLPGGMDTLDQFGELVAPQHAEPAKPILLANHDGYFDPLLAQLDRGVAEEFVTAAERNLIEAVRTVDGVLRRLVIVPGEQQTVPR